MKTIITTILAMMIAATANAKGNTPPPPRPETCPCAGIAAQAKAGIAANAALTMAIAGVKDGKGLALGIGLAEYGGDKGAAIGGVFDLGNGITLNGGVLLPEGGRASPAIGVTWNF